MDTSPAKPAEVTVRGLVAYLVPDPEDRRRVLGWPPDVFAIAASLLQKSGAYTRVVRTWPPPCEPPGAGPHAWAPGIRDVGRRWRLAAGNDEPPPQEVRTWWDAVLSYQELPIAEMAQHEDLSCALIELCAAADEACAGVGIPASGGDAFWKAATLRLDKTRAFASTLCQRIDGAQLQVLPKIHTPQNGLTLRSLTLNLALCPGREVHPKWFLAPVSLAPHGLNLLVVPWPPVVKPSCFTPADPPHNGLLNMPEHFSFFAYKPVCSDEDAERQVMALYESARDSLGRVDGVVLPEAALGEDTCDRLRRWLAERNVMLICGVGAPPTVTPGHGRNEVHFGLPVSFAKKGIKVSQPKHHRWRLDRRQIVQYGLGGGLDPTRFWWEQIPVADRDLVFIAMGPWLTLCALVCEDLARQDPVYELVRAVGPTLVIALLMDGPQLAARWPGRYATVLADDPGCSVLTLTSAGMAALSRPSSGPNRSDVIALWKDGRSGESVELELPRGAGGLVLSLTREMVAEWSADGRSDAERTGYLTLSGVHPVFIPLSKAEPPPPRAGLASREPVK